MERRATLARRSLVDENFPKQAAFIRSKAKFKAALCTRRAGKSYGGGAWLLEPIFKEKNVTTLYIALTRDSAKRIMWRDVLKEIDANHGLDLRPNETDLTLTNTSNGSMIGLIGADSGPHEMKKFLGSKLRRVVIDEAADFRQDLQELVNVLIPALADHEGELALTGTVGAICQGLFYDVTRPELALRKPGWDVHEWKSNENPYMRDKIAKQIAELEAQNPRIRETPWFRRMYDNEWVPDDKSLCYRYRRGYNDLAVLPAGSEAYVSVLGVDLGWSDASAFSIGSYRAHDPNLYVQDFYKAKGMDISDVAERIRYYQRRYNPFAMVIDGANKQAVEEMKNRFLLPLEAAEKKGKAEFIELMGSEFLTQRIYLVGEALDPLREEYEGLIWDPKELPKKVEHSACENHGADATLYMWRKAFSYLAQARPAPKQRETIDEWEERQAQSIGRKTRSVLGLAELEEEPEEENPFRSRRGIFGA